MSMRSQDRLLVETLFRRAPVFKKFSEVRLKQVIEDFDIRHVNKEETIVYQSDESTDLYAVLEGKVRVTYLNKDGEELVITSFNEGDFFGEMSLIDGKPRSATVVAEDATTLGVLTREKLFESIAQDPQIAIDLLAALVERLRKANEMIESLAFLDVRRRLLRFLVHLAEEEGEEDKNGFLKFKKLTHKDLASRIGASREAITKVLKILNRNEKIIEKGNYVLIPPNVQVEEVGEI